MPSSIEIPQFALVLLVGASGTGKSTFAGRHFRPTEVVSSDRARGWVADDETDQSTTPDAFELVHAIVDKRLKHRRLTVVDATNVEREARKPLVALAKRWHAPIVAIVLDLPEEVAVQRNVARPDRAFGAGPVRRQMDHLERSLAGLAQEGIRRVHRLRSVEEVNAASIVRVRPCTDRRDDQGPFDIIGDVHGCADELQELLALLGYRVEWTGADVSVVPPPGRRAIFVGDLVDRGPRAPDVLRIARHMVDRGSGLAVAGNHDDKLKRHLSGKRVKPTHGLAATLSQLSNESKEFTAATQHWLDGLVTHYVLDDGRLVVAHAGLREEMHGRASGAVKAFSMYGETTGEVDESGLPVRLDWALDYRGRATVVYGHTPVQEPVWVNNTLCIDTGCCFGGKLTALRYPEMTLVSVPARRTYEEPARPLRLIDSVRPV